MAFFVGAGTIADDVVRKETRNGVLAVFRLETGAPNNRRLWIDVEAWGHLAGTIAHHASAGRAVLVSGRLTQKTWRDTQSGQARSRYVVTALDIDLLTDNTEPILLPTTVVVDGTVQKVYSDRPTANGVVHSFRLVSGRAGTKTGRLWIDVEHWTSTERSPAVTVAVAVAVGDAAMAIGQLAFARRADCEARHQAQPIHLRAHHALPGGRTSAGYT